MEKLRHWDAPIFDYLKDQTFYLPPGFSTRWQATGAIFDSLNSAQL